MRKLIAQMPPVSQSLAKQLVRTILTAYFLIAVAVTSGQLIYDFQHEKDNQYRKIDSLIANFERSLSEALWNFDEEQISALISGLTRNEEILGAAIVGNDEFQFSQGEIGELTATKNNGGSIANYKQYYSVYSPEDPEEKIGNVYVFSGIKTVLSRASTTFFVSLLAATLKTLALWFIAVRVIDRFVGLPITKLQNDILSFDIEEAKSYEESELSNNELNHLDNELDRLKACFQGLFEELKNQNYIIHNQTKHLETLVSERTAELNQIVAQLEQANAIKTNFLANISHELRTPLNAIIGFTRRLVRNVEKEQLITENREARTHKDGEIYAIILRNSEALLELINKMLDMSRISGGQIVLSKRRLEIGQIISAVLEHIRPSAQEKSLNLEVSIAPNLFIYADPERITQLVSNLLSNAIKFTQHGTIAISAASETMDNIPGCAIAVLDTGVGISDNDLPMLFKHFQKVGDDNLNTVPGTGLGLAIVYELVRLHHGEIRVDSILGKGSLFHVWLPSFEDDEN